MYPDFVDLLRAFVDSRVRFLVVGAHALALHGRPRATGDLDLWAEPTASNAQKVFSALKAFGAPLEHVSPQTFTEPDVVFQIGIAPVRIDILTSISGINSFKEAFSKSVEASIEDLTVRFLGREDLIANKLAAGRPKDLLDVARLEKRSRRR